jgi:hypothetical protein
MMDNYLRGSVTGSKQLPLLSADVQGDLRDVTLDSTYPLLH